MMKKGLISRILITLLGIGLVFMGASQVVLGFAGKRRPPLSPISGARAENARTASRGGIPTI
jgi:hypothetical protein